MADPIIPDDLLALLQRVDTPTVCNAIEVAQGKRGFDAFTKGTMQCSAPGEVMVGFARTAKIAGREPPNEAPDVIRARRLDYFRAMAAGPRPAIAVIEDVDFPHCVSAWWGEVHTNVHKGLGLNGALTNGVMRDLGDLAAGFPVVAGSIGPSHAFVHVRELGTPVKVFGMEVQQGDLVHADRHGALVIPPDVIPDLKAAIEKMWAGERIILGPAKEPGFDLEKLLAAWADFERART
ncbi:RraA family protein [Cognatiyoonia sp. IB215446]|uniref:RraA family protein n=1 Tax=Cognatiyoonia sp. IB215446 TaxID=3097355 RepID=UPI002A1606E7|nr:RraA family protein [Cognatiyoonia sp. IB215446]MDX8350328.1 RraA family protein [Cognatiyoonia sp. IB215446]